jgi:hypothetical protein
MRTSPVERNNQRGGHQCMIDGSLEARSLLSQVSALFVRVFPRPHLVMVDVDALRNQQCVHMVVQSQQATCVI